MCSEDGLSTRHRDEHLQFQVGGGWRGGSKGRSEVTRRQSAEQQLELEKVGTDCARGRA